MEITQKTLREFWKVYPDDFRIEAVIHDGQWYTKEKWAKVAQIKDEKILDEWIEDHSDILIRHKNSYRVGKEEIIKWYELHDLNIKQKLVPSNFPPRIWDNQTEAEALLNAPRRLTSYVNFKMTSSKLFKKVEKIIKPYSRIYVYASGKVYAYTLSGEYLRGKLQKELTEEEYKEINPRVRSGFYRRDIMEFSDEYLREALEFYQALALTLLRPHKKTLDIFLPSRDDLKSQVSEWVISALQKFDEREPVPFSGYLATVLSRWPYDLPDYELGRELATYQRARAKVVENFNKEHLRQPTLEEIEKHLDYTHEKFLELETIHDQWNKIKMLQSFTQSGVDNHVDSGDMFFNSTETANAERITVKHNLALAMLRASVHSGKYIEGIKLLNELGKAEFDFDVIHSIPVELKELLLYFIKNDTSTPPEKR